MIIYDVHMNNIYISFTHKTFYQFVKFGIVGLSNTFIGYVVYTICVWLGMHYLLANVVGFLVSVLNAFYWSDRFVFRKGSNEQRGLWTSFLKTVLAYASTGILLNSILLWLFIDELNLSEYIAPLIILLITVPTNFILNKYWSFKTINMNEED